MYHFTDLVMISIKEVKFLITVLFWMVHQFKHFYSIRVVSIIGFYQSRSLFFKKFAF